MKFKYTVGMEMTGIIPEYKERISRYGQGPTNATVHLTRAYSTLISTVLSKEYPNSFEVGTHLDGHCLEFPSPVFSTTEQMDKFYLLLKKQFKKYKITAQHPATVCGGNHIHFGIKDNVLLKKIFRDFITHYYVPWVFTQPDDTDSCDNLITKHPEEDTSIFADNFTNAMVPIFYTNKMPTWGHLDGIKGYAISTNKPKNIRTIEFRCVEAPLNLSELHDQLDFFIAYVNYVAKRPMPSPIVGMTIEELNAITPKEAKDKFNALLLKLKLSPKRYAKYVRRNLYPRWKMKRQRV